MLSCSLVDSATNVYQIGLRFSGGVGGGGLFITTAGSLVLFRVLRTKMGSLLFRILLSRIHAIVEFCLLYLTL